MKKGKLLLHFAKNGLSTASTPSNLQRRTDSELDFHHRSFIFNPNLSLSCASLDVTVVVYVRIKQVCGVMLNFHHLRQ